MHHTFLYIDRQKMWRAIDRCKNHKLCTINDLYELFYIINQGLHEIQLLSFCHFPAFTEMRRNRSTHRADFPFFR